MRFELGRVSPYVILYASPAVIIKEYSTEMGILTAEKARQFDPSTTDEDSNTKVLDSVSIILILKNVADNKLVSVVLQ